MTCRLCFLFCLNRFTSHKAIVITAVTFNTVRCQIQNSVGKFIYKISVVRYHYHSTVIIGKCIFKSLSRFNVKMVCRFVHYKQINTLKHKFYKFNSRSLATRQLMYFLKHIFAFKQKYCKCISDLSLSKVRIFIPYLVYNRFIHIKIFLNLVIVSYMNIRTDFI